ncbi:hypothetical protein [Neptuniibacter pectenicola]|uniref:hypothetical protein n=1 Tax=Neptuniibacter pectenicola TaxID=1806669 RepID=UPI000AFF40EB|nr:hypothetical protein [Neptuniibacter pectenicola]
MIQRLFIDSCGTIGFAALTAGLYLKYGLAETAIISGLMLVVFSALAAIRRGR